MPFELKPGQGTLHKTVEKKTENSPDYFGDINIGGTMYKLSGWLKIGQRSKWISLAAELPKQKAALVTPPPRGPIAQADIDADIPF